MPRGLLDTTRSFIAEQESGRPQLLVFSDVSMSVATIAHDGTYVIGRDPSDVDLHLDDPAISRRHASIELDGARATLNDLRSQNGTKLNGIPVTAPMPLSSGDVILLGNIRLVFGRTKSTPQQTGVLDPDRFAEKLASELERAQRYLRPLTLMLVGRGTRASDDELLTQSLALSARKIDAVGRLDPRTLAVLIPEDAPGGTGPILRAALRADRAIRAGTARWPDDAPDAESLIDAARAALERAEAGTLSEALHTTRVVQIGARRAAVADPAMMQLFMLAERLAPSDVAVLITGESGAGKELIARALHQGSNRKERPFVTVDCAAAGESELSTQLEEANGGTLFLDEVGGLAPVLQAKLVRAIEEMPDVRFVAATRRDLARDAEEDRFRRDLYYRLNAAMLLVPPLRKRPRDILAIARQVLEELSASEPARELEFSPGTLRALSMHSWPGNVRELRHAIERAAALAQSPVIEPWLLPAELTGNAVEEEPPAQENASATPALFRPLEEELRELERRRIEQALVVTGGVQSKAAALLRVPLRTFYWKVKQYAIEIPKRDRDKSGDSA